MGKIVKSTSIVHLVLGSNIVLEKDRDTMERTIFMSRLTSHLQINSYPRMDPAALSRSNSAAIVKASGLTSTTAWKTSSISDILAR